MSHTAQCAACPVSRIRGIVRKYSEEISHFTYLKSEANPIQSIYNTMSNLASQPGVPGENKRKK